MPLTVECVGIEFDEARIARYVVIGTADTNPTDPTRDRTTSVAMTSREAIELIDSRVSVKSRSSGNAAPAYARNRVFTVDEM